MDRTDREVIQRIADALYVTLGDADDLAERLDAAARMSADRLREAVGTGEAELEELEGRWRAAQGALASGIAAGLQASDMPMIADPVRQLAEAVKTKVRELSTLRDELLRIETGRQVHRDDVRLAAERAVRLLQLAHDDEELVTDVRGVVRELLKRVVVGQDGSLTIELDTEPAALMRAFGRVADDALIGRSDPAGRVRSAAA